MRGPEIKRRFRLEWEGMTVLRLYPVSPLKPLKKYSLVINRWTAHCLDGRVLKNYTGMFGSFTTDEDVLPAVTSTSPVNGDTEVPRSGPFEVRFNRPMNPASLYEDLLLEVTDVVSGARVTLNGSSLDKEFDVTWSEDDTVLFLVPRRMLKASRPYLVRLVSTGLKSRSGKAVQGMNYLWGQFSTGDL